MSDEEQFTDVLALRASSLAQFQKVAREYLTAHPDMQSMVLGVSQFFADEAGDAVHEKLVAFKTREPSWPHTCTYGETPSEDGSVCGSCEPRGTKRTIPWGFLDSNTSAVLAWSAFCTEWGGGEGSSNLVDAIAVVRRNDDGGFDLELVHEVVRPTLDDNSVAESRDEEFWDEDGLPPKPEPVRAPWSGEERKLFEAVLANPRDDGPRRVMVDYWLERGDVRGEFGALSFETPKTSKDRARRFALEQEHGRAWLGPLQQVAGFGSVKLGRGPFARRLAASLRLDGDAAAVADLEDWPLVEAIDFVGTECFFSKRMTGLSEILGLDAAGLRAFSEVKGPIKTIGLTQLVGADEWPDSLRGVETLLLHRVRRWEPGAEAAWAKVIERSCAKQIELWFTASGWEDDGGEFNEEGLRYLETGEFGPWSDERGALASKGLGALLKPDQTLKVGYQFGNGARGGVIAVRTGGSKEVTLEAGRFASGSAQRLAEARLSEQGAKSLKVDTSPTGIRKLLARFGL
ncbi:MAG: hypothetical protein QM817_19770 [Archangium sp.]